MTMLKYRGVIETEDGRFAAVIYKNGQEALLGIYDSPEVAAYVWDTVTFATLGDFAILNYPELFDIPASALVTGSAA